MDERIEKLISKNDSKLYEWTEIINSFPGVNSSENSEEESVDGIYKLVNIFSEIIELVLSFGRFKDEFEYDKFYANYYGPELIINSTKTKSTFYLGIDETGIYLRSHLRNNYNIRNMEDKFWLDLLSLYNYGSFQMEESEGFSKKNRTEFPEIFNVKKSIIFNIFRKFFVDVILEKDNYHKYDIVGDFGDLKISWNENFGLDKIIEELCYVFKILYSLNYKLWKIEDLKKQ
ncbi:MULTISPECIES: hypothetical protein [Chryseobacterium]|uniref:Uncharacterized protein n=1 Tax=Chryseobacterium aquaticum subsp. greenlandense TaxID=345663 RepID=A0A101CHI9_9FLAO|nr:MULTISPECIES: hypothetical protein [Chryseobacterium]KNB61159.1 hypothetical protein AC804_11255 [Chryseobacterium sp. Hurlbut01]KUJ56352.1 hypothetical protein AR686_07255 [Chryseobacterium aquaticum subsp. greenlandense]